MATVILIIAFLIEAAFAACCIITRSNQEKAGSYLRIGALAAVPDANAVVAVQHVTATAPDAFKVHLAGTDHLSLTDLPLISPFLVSVINASVPKAGGHEADPLATTNQMNEIVLEFFNVYLKGEGKFTAAGTY